MGDDNLPLGRDNHHDQYCFTGMIIPMSEFPTIGNWRG